ncbi:MAG: hypothetical protein VB055_01290 [Oscillospiraceae bacterium]|nr:hypothetical protein [Oscillospiraceae bacterium]
MIRIRDLSLCPGDGEPQLLRAAAKQLGCTPKEILRMQLVKKSVDARKKQDVRMIYTVDVSVRGDEAVRVARAKSPRVSIAAYHPYQPPAPAAPPENRPVVVGFGPGGMFAALLLAEAGLRPIVLERGQDATARREAVNRFWETGALDPECNVQFGEGGAGTFSDGKLNTGTNDDRVFNVLHRFAEFGAPEEILCDAKPHIGTDVLVEVVQALRRRVESLGGEVRFGAKLTGLTELDCHMAAITYTQQGNVHTLPCSRLILAIGHSARDTFQMLEQAGLPMEPKPFSMGVRIEHRQADIDKSQYGPFAGHPALPPADYKLNCRLPDGSSAYTFCMCPGGYVVAAASETGGVVTNGMSNHDRGGENANSALLVTLKPEDFPYDGPLGGCRWQREIEEAAFSAGGGDYRAPAQLLSDFLASRPSAAFGAVRPTYRPGVTFCNLDDVLPKRITDTLRSALPVLDRSLRGFLCPDAVLTAPETRSSSPVRILRDDGLQAALRGLFPCGEGAGYAGGITSAAVDGLRCAEALIASL